MTARKGRDERAGAAHPSPKTDAEEASVQWRGPPSLTLTQRPTRLPVRARAPSSRTTRSPRRSPTQSFARASRTTTAAAAR